MPIAVSARLTFMEKLVFVAPRMSTTGSSNKYDWYCKGKHII